MRTKALPFIALLFTFTKIASAQDSTNLMNQLIDQTEKGKKNYTESTFIYTRILDGHSVETLPKNVLDVRISHRFGPLNSGIYNFFGLDYSPFNVRLGFDYGITNNIMVGGGHSGFQKTYDLFSKFRVMRQSTGSSNMPFTITIVPTFAISSLDQNDFFIKPDSGTAIKRVSYVFQALIARKFSEGFSMQLMPTLVHPDNISFAHTSKNIFAVGVAGRQKVSKRMSVVAEYYYQLPDEKAPGSHNVLSFGLNLWTGGHVFQLMFTNSYGLTEKSFIAETPGSWSNGDELFGFNISRVFELGKKHKK
jgi:hypothetical protein